MPALHWGCQAARWHRWVGEHQGRCDGCQFGGQRWWMCPELCVDGVCVWGGGWGWGCGWWGRERGEGEEEEGEKGYLGCNFYQSIIHSCSSRGAGVAMADAVSLQLITNNCILEVWWQKACAKMNNRGRRKWSGRWEKSCIHGLCFHLRKYGMATGHYWDWFSLQCVSSI